MYQQQSSNEISVNETIPCEFGVTNESTIKRFNAATILKIKDLRFGKLYLIHFFGNDNRNWVGIATSPTKFTDHRARLHCCKAVPCTDRNGRAKGDIHWLMYSLGYNVQEFGLKEDDISIITAVASIAFPSPGSKVKYEQLLQQEQKAKPIKIY